MKLIYKRDLKRVLIKTVIVLSILIAYQVGQFNGFINGVSRGYEDNNKSICDFINVTEDEEGYCIMSEEAKFNQSARCPWGKVRTIGSEPKPKMYYVAETIRRIALSPILGVCI